MDEFTSDIAWEFKIISTETIAVVNDTDKEDIEESIRLTWESAQPGRAEHAKKNRLRHLAELKRDSNLELDEEDVKILEETWESRRKSYKEFIASSTT